MDSNRQVNFMHYVVSASLVIVGLIHLLPLVGVLGPDRLASMYGVACSEENLAILMRHRAVLFGLLGALLVLAAFHVPSQPVAFAAGFVSIVSFLWLAWSVGGYNAQLARVVTADVVALICLMGGLISYLLARPSA